MRTRETALLMLKGRRDPGEIQQAAGLSTGQLAALAEVHGLSRTAARSGGPIAGLDPELARGLAALVWVEQNGQHQGARRHAAQVRELLRDLVQYQSRTVAEARIRADITAIGKKLSTLRSRLSRLESGSGGTSLIRDWAKEQGIRVSPSGVLSASLIDAFEQHTRPTAQLEQRRAITVARLQREIATLKKNRTTARKRLENLRGPSPAAIRAWAKEQGLDVPDTGVLPDRIVEAYKAHHQPTSSAQQVG
jgi:hypothetical protein